MQDSPDSLRSRPPQAKRLPHRLEKHGHVRQDPYYWMRNRSDPEVLEYLKAENTYADAVMAPQHSLEEELFHEVKGRMKPADRSVPFKLGDYWYHIRYESEREYGIYCRQHKGLDSPEEIMLDANQLAEGHEYFALGNWMVSANHDLLAYAVDVQGRRMYTLYVKDLRKGHLLSDVLSEVTATFDWANDNRTLFYSRQDPDTLRSYQIYRHRLGTPQHEDDLVYEEADETFSAYVYKTKSRKFLLIACHQSITSEYRYLSADDPSGSFRVLHPRERGHEYDVDHLGDRFYIRTNDQATNFRLMTTSVSTPGKSTWEEMVPHRENVFFEGFELFQDYMVLEERRGGLVHFRVCPLNGEESHEMVFDEPAYSVSFGDNHELATPMLRFGYTSMTTPMTIYDYHMGTREKILQKQEEVLGGFNSTHYRTERIEVPVGGGVKVPVSLVYRRDGFRKGAQPLLLYGYGAYGISLDASFSSARLSLLDRGFVYALAHVRGGEELGRQWYEDGKLLKKKNSFTDFIACAEYLSKEGYGHPQRLFAMGGSAGGLLMGAVINMRPDLFKGVVAQVPFVDVLTTMLDPSIPLTTGEYDEWGDPNIKEYYDYILSYSPYDNVEAKAYPHLLVTSGLHDSQVQYWEPAKWVAKLRATKTDSHLLLLKTNLEAGHGGASGRFKQYRETALIYAFLLDVCSREG